MTAFTNDDPARRLDHDANPHPTMWARAVDYYRAAIADGATVADKWRWFGYWDAMLDATGYPPERLWATFTDKLGLTRP